MSEVITKDVISNHFGFPILLINAPHINIDGEEVLQINYITLAKKVFYSLAIKPSKLTGAEVKFIRHYLEMTQQGFADWVMTERSTVAKWEKFDLQPTNMDLATEQVLRLNMLLKESNFIDREVYFQIKDKVKNIDDQHPIKISA